MRPRDDLPRWLFFFALAYAFMHIAPILLASEIENRLTWGDLLAILTPLIVVPAAWMVYSRTPAEEIGPRPTVAFWWMLASSLLYASGQGMNLAANAIARHLVGQETTPLFRLTYFFDETLGHILWHAGTIGMTWALLIRARSLLASRIKLWSLVGSVLFALAYFTDAVEGQTVFMLLPIALAMMIWLGTKAFRPRRPAEANVLEIFFLTGYGMALLLFLIWRIWQGGFPQFSELGWI